MFHWRNYVTPYPPASNHLKGLIPYFTSCIKFLRKRPILQRDIFQVLSLFALFPLDLYYLHCLDFKSQIFAQWKKNQQLCFVYSKDWYWQVGNYATLLRLINSCHNLAGILSSIYYPDCSYTVDCWSATINNLNSS